MLKNTPMRLLHTASGGRLNRLKLWMRPIIHADYRTETETRAGRRRLRAIKHQAKLRHKQRKLYSK